jgi:DNA-binding NtrC family response regulator
LLDSACFFIRSSYTKLAGATDGPAYKVKTLGGELPKTLLVEPDEELRSSMTRVLQGCGLTVEGLGRVPQRAGGVPVIPTDRWRLIVVAHEPPDTSAMELLDWAVQQTPPIPVVFTSAAATVPAAVTAMRQGVCDYLIKPFDPERLKAAVGNALETFAVSPSRAPESTHRSSQKTFITCDARLMDVLRMARQVARSTATVLIQGESGTGKELLAAFIHRHGLHPTEPYIAVNCAALPEQLAESELFGHERGAFTGAVSRKAGKFELAKRGTLVLDEIGEMPLALQAKLLRALQEREIDRVGGTQPIPVEARVVAITNRDLAQAVARGHFREDLYFRIHVVPLIIPPLRSRIGDIPLLADHFLAYFSARYEKKIRCFSEGARQLLGQHEWKGNVRELENRVERAVLLAEGDKIEPLHLGLNSRMETPVEGSAGMIVRPGTTVWEMERQLIMGTLSEVNHNRTRAAGLLGISIRTLRNKLREYRLPHEPRAQASSA